MYFCVEGGDVRTCVHVLYVNVCIYEYAYLRGGVFV